MENDIPKIDLPQDWVIGKLTAGDIGLLNLYANYPMPVESGDFRAMPRRRDRGIHQLDATQGRTRKLHHHHARYQSCRSIGQTGIYRSISWDSHLISSAKANCQ